MVRDPLSIRGVQTRTTGQRREIFMTASDIHSRPVNLKDVVAYQDGSIVSRILLKSSAGSVTAFAFDEGQELSEHTAPFDALVSVLDGEVDITISGELHRLKYGQVIILPANEPHALRAVSRFKMILTMLRAVA